METATNQSVQLWVRKDSDLTYTRIDLFPEEPIKLNLSVTNIMDPLATNSVFSRTFRVPNTQSNNKFFKAVFNVNSVSFDASKKVAAYLNDSGAFYINGNILLISTYSNDLEGDVQYEIVFMGETSAPSTTSMRRCCTTPLANSRRCFLPSRRTVRRNHLDKALTQDTPTPCKPPDTL